MVIVGRGPVGATLANLLGLCGVRTLVLEREARAYHLPRAVHYDDECMRLFQTIGLAEDILPHVILSPGMRFVDAEGHLILDWPRPQELTPMGWHLSYRFHQPDLEDILISHVSTGGSHGEDRLTENVTLNFAKFKLEYTPQTEKGAGGKKQEASWNIPANK